MATNEIQNGCESSIEAVLASNHKRRCDKSTGRLLGAQLIGHWKSEISKRVDIFATALFHNMKVESLNELDLSYTPPLSSPWDPVQMAAQAWCRSIATPSNEPITIVGC